MIFVIALTNNNAHAQVTTPTIEWMKGLEESTAYGPAIGNDGTIYLATDKTEILVGSLAQPNYYAPCKLFALDHVDGSEKWHINFGENEYGGAKPEKFYIRQPAIGSDGTIYVIVNPLSVTSDASSYLYAVNPTGSIKWFFEQKPLQRSYIYNNEIKYYTNSTILNNLNIGIDGKILFSSSTTDESSLFLLNHSGSVYNKITIDSNSGFKGTSISGIIAGKDNTVYLSTKYATGVSYLYSVSQEGDINWTSIKFNNEITSLVLDSNDNIIGKTPSGLFAINKTGQVKWTRDFFYRARGGLAIGDDDTLYYSGKHGIYGNEVLTAISTEDNTTLWTFKLLNIEEGQGIASLSIPHITSDGRINVGVSEGTFLNYDILPTNSNLFSINPDGSLHKKIIPSELPPYEKIGFKNIAIDSNDIFYVQYRPLFNFYGAEKIKLFAFDFNGDGIFGTKFPWPTFLSAIIGKGN